MIGESAGREGVTRKGKKRDSPFIANSLSVFFSLTRYTLPTSPLPKSLIFWKLLGPTWTERILIELLEYVLRNAALGVFEVVGEIIVSSPCWPVIITGDVGRWWSLLNPMLLLARPGRVLIEGSLRPPLPPLPELLGR